MYYNYHASLSRHVTSANTQHTEANKFIMNGQGGLADTAFENVKSETFIYSKSCHHEISYFISFSPKQISGIHPQNLGRSYRCTG